MKKVSFLTIAVFGCSLALAQTHKVIGNSENLFTFE